MVKNYPIETLGNTPEFEELLIQKAEQEQRVGKLRDWVYLLEIYIRQKEIISHNPFLESEEFVLEDELPPSIKVLERHIRPEYEGRLYRWGMEEVSVGNFRIIYIIYDYYKVLLLHYFDKQYNGDVKRTDIEPAETIYEEYLQKYLSSY